MRTVSPATEAAWKAALRGGDTRPTVRATIEDGRMRHTPYNTNDAPGGDYDRLRKRKGHFRNINFGATRVQEIRNLRSCEWSRSVDQDIAECTLTVLNTELVPIGTEPTSDDFDLPGLYTFNRGDVSNRWGNEVETGWNGRVVPDRLVRTFEGYGSDESAAPGNDENLYQSGTWLIDEVNYDANGDIAIQMRDLGRLLVDHIVFKPVVPHDDYPMDWSKIESVMLPARTVVGGDWQSPAASCTSSNIKFANRDIVDDIPYVNSRGGVLGHYPQHAYDDNDGHWMSTGQTGPNDMVWWEARFKKIQAEVGGLRIRERAGPYRIYISIANADGWIGKRTIPYQKADGAPGNVNISADIPFVEVVNAERGQLDDVIFKRMYRDVRKIRLTFTRLRRNTGTSLTYPWRAGLSTVKVYSGKNIGFAQGEALTPVGNYRDYTDIVKWVGAWCGWWWPPRNDNFLVRSTGGAKDPYEYVVNDRVLPAGRVWGTFQGTGTAGVADLTPDLFDKQPLLDVIQYVRDVTGFMFHIDEVGGMVWRQHNLWSLGNWVSGHHNNVIRKPTRTEDIITIDENETLKSYSTKLSSRNLRERVFVANSTGKFGTVVRGYNPYPTGLLRIAGWTDQNWKTRRETVVAADMIAARQTFDYRRSQMTIPANPAIQVDDQVRIFERVTNETYYHYVIGVSSSLDMEAGTWDYSLQTHWLGEDPNDAWAVRVDQLDAVTQSYLNTIGEVE